MESTGRFLLGGALGAALGYLLSKKGLDQTQETAEASPTPAPPAAASVPTWSAPVSEPATPDEPTPVTAAPAGPEIILTRQFLEEPLPGAGWTPSVPSAVEDETMESEVTLEEAALESAMLDEVMEVPLVEDVTIETTEQIPSQPVGPGTAGTEALAQAATVAGSIPVVETPSVQDSAHVDDLKSRIEETRRRIRRELEQPFESSPVDMIESDWTMAPAVPVAEPVEEAPVAAAEQELVEPVIMEPPAAAPVAAEPPLATEPPAVDEPAVMESPTMETIEVEAMEPQVMEPPVAEPPAPEPLAPLLVQPSAVAPMVEEQAPAAPADSAPLDLGSTVSDADATAEAVVESEPVDYDSMKIRIESTRSRLKAKAFDAMMTGESALLGRDAEGARADRGDVSGVDDEVDETIETSLREEEE